MPHRLVGDVEDFRGALEEAIAAPGPRLIEIDMCAIGPFAEAFSGPPAGAAGNKE
jgi:acetolactate synthase-1/2/3 large subunit